MGKMGGGHHRDVQIEQLEKDIGFAEIWAVTKKNYMAFIWLYSPSNITYKVLHTYSIGHHIS